ncbi:MAG: hypothetical protein Q9213_002082 [Squamulea squamosa]
MLTDSGRKVIIGLDFGTTTTQGAYFAPRDIRGSSGTANQPATFRETEIYAIALSSNGHTEPTKLAWHTSKGRFIYGSEVDREIRLGSIKPEDIIDLPKLSLDRSAQTLPLRARQKHQREQIPHEHGTPPPSSVYIIAQYLKWIKGRLLEIITANLGCIRYEDLAVADHATWVLTLPANWEEASDDLRQAAREAGLGEVELVTETEAAATAMLGNSEDGLSSDFAQEPVLVLDVGGGTHNIITYLVKPDGTMEEGIPGTGGLSGSYWLNQNFQDLLANQWRYTINNFLMGKGRDPDNVTHVRKLLDECVNEFENEKKRFDGFSAVPEERQMVIPIRGILDPPLEPGSKSIVLPHTKCEAMFACIIDPILTAIEQQISSFNTKHSPLIIRRIFFFGGLSKSPHVRKTILKRFFDEEIMGYPVDVIVPPVSISRMMNVAFAQALVTYYSEVVVAKGAVLKSLRGDIITTRFRRRNFGVVEDVPWNKFRGDADSAVVSRDIEDNELRVRNRAVWLFRNDDEYDGRSVRIHRGWRAVPVDKPIRFREFLISSPHKLEDQADILDPGNGHLEFYLDEKERSDFVLIWNKITRQWYKAFQYEVRFAVGYLSRDFELVIPRGSYFPSDWRQIPGMNGADDDARLGPDPIRQSAPVVRHVDLKDVEEDPSSIYKFQDAEFERMMVDKARSPTGYWVTLPREIPRLCHLGKTKGSNLNSPRIGIGPHQGTSKKRTKQRILPNGVGKQNSFPRCEWCIRSHRKCQRISMKDKCSACEKAGRACQTRQPGDLMQEKGHSRAQGTVGMTTDEEPEALSFAAAPETSHPTQRMALQAPPPITEERESSGTQGPTRKSTNEEANRVGSTVTPDIFYPIQRTAMQALGQLGAYFTA